MGRHRESERAERFRRRLKLSHTNQLKRETFYALENLRRASWPARFVGGALFALILSLVNMSIKQILQVLSLPVTVLTLGIFYLIVNTLLLYIAAWLANGLFGAGFYIASFGSAFVASIVISVVSTILNGLLGDTD